MLTTISTAIDTEQIKELNKFKKRGKTRALLIREAIDLLLEKLQGEKKTN